MGWKEKTPTAVVSMLIAAAAASDDDGPGGDSSAGVGSCSGGCAADLELTTLERETEPAASSDLRVAVTPPRRRFFPCCAAAFIVLICSSIKINRPQATCSGDKRACSDYHCPLPHLLPPPSPVEGNGDRALNRVQGETATVHSSSIPNATR